MSDLGKSIESKIKFLLLFIPEARIEFVESPNQTPVSRTFEGLIILIIMYSNSGYCTPWRLILFCFEMLENFSIALSLIFLNSSYSLKNLFFSIDFSISTTNESLLSSDIAISLFFLYLFFRIKNLKG